MVRPPSASFAGRVSGAQKRTRTSTPLRAPAPEAGASTNSAIWARGRRAPLRGRESAVNSPANILRRIYRAFEKSEPSGRSLTSPPRDRPAALPLKQRASGLDKWPGSTLFKHVKCPQILVATLWSGHTPNWPRTKHGCPCWQPAALWPRRDQAGARQPYPAGLSRATGRPLARQSST
jgi:hypothetical protein